MDRCDARPGRKPRADSLRNRERLLEAAKAVFSAGGTEASLEAVARNAGVGIGTLYRHFPTRDALFEAVYRREADQLAALAETLEQAEDPVAALKEWVAAIVEVIAAKKGMLSVLAPAPEGQAELYAYTGPTMRAALERLLVSAATRGAIRADISAEELIQAMYGMISSTYMRDSDQWKPKVLRLAGVLIDGLALGMRQSHPDPAPTGA